MSGKFEEIFKYVDGIAPIITVNKDDPTRFDVVGSIYIKGKLVDVTEIGIKSLPRQNYWEIDIDGNLIDKAKGQDNDA